MALKIGYQQLVADAEQRVKSIPVSDLLSAEQREDCILIDLRDVRELWREGTIPGSVHVPRGMVEFWIDPESPYYHKIFAEPKPFIFFCNKGWRSALVADVTQRMGLEQVAHLEGGFERWVEEGGEVMRKEKK